MFSPIVHGAGFSINMRLLFMLREEGGKHKISDHRSEFLTGPSALINQNETKKKEAS